MPALSMGKGPVWLPFSQASHVDEKVRT